MPDRRTFLMLAGLGAVATTGRIALTSPAAAATEPFLPYSADSFFRSRAIGLPVNSTLTAQFRQFMVTHPDQKNRPYPTITGMNTGGKVNPWGTTTHVSSATDPVWKLANPRKETAILQTQGFHMADDVARRVPTGTQDRAFLIVDPVFGYSTFCGDVVPNYAARTITVGASSVFWHSSNGLDKRNPRSNDPRNFSSRGRIPDSGVIRSDLIRAGIANGTSLGYVLHMWFVETLTSAGFVHPMVGAEGGKNGWGAEGVRIAIRPDLDLSTRFTGGALVLAKTLQEYGCVVGDNSGSGSTFHGEQATATYNPYAGTNVTRDCLKGLTWADWVVIQPGAQ